jgi:hypothetical protein
MERTRQLNGKIGRPRGGFRSTTIRDQSAGVYGVDPAENPRPELHFEDERPPVIIGDHGKVPSLPAKQT